MKNIKKDILVRVRLVYIAIALFGLAIVGRVVYLQQIRGSHWRAKAEERLIQTRDVSAARGNIYSDNGSLLATSLPRFKVAFDPGAAKQSVFEAGIDSLAIKLSDYFQTRTPQEFEHYLSDARQNGRRYLVLSRDLIGYQDKKQMEQWPIFRRGRMGGGIIFERVNERYRPFNELAKRTIGFVNKDRFDHTKGVVGLEYSFNKQLKGHNGQALFRRMHGGHWKPVNDGTAIKPENGSDLHTTLDVNLQDVAETALHKALIRHKARYGCAVLMEVETGHIKAMANLGRNEAGNYVEKYNYAVGAEGRVNPGSTFKLASYMALLEDNRIAPKDTIDCGNGIFKFYDNELREPYAGSYGKITMRQAFQKSSNVISRLIHENYKDKPQRFLDYLEQFGLSDPLGFQMVGTAQPYIKKINDHTWSGITLPWMAVGYECELTPLHMLTFYNAVANGGTMMRPLLVEEVRQAEDLLRQYEPHVLRKQICSKQTIRTLNSLLKGVVQHGTARNIRNAEYAVAGKTGTSQKIQNGHYIDAYYTSFVGYFPADRPKYSCIVVIDDPQGQMSHGSDVAAPVFKEIADKVYATDIELHQPLKVRERPKGTFPVVQAGHFQDLHYICNKLGISNHPAEGGVDEWVRSTTHQNAIYWKPKRVYAKKVPDVRGLTLKDALYILENRKMNVLPQGKGRVYMQSLQPGTRIRAGMDIKLWLKED